MNEWVQYQADIEAQVLQALKYISCFSSGLIIPSRVLTHLPWFWSKPGSLFDSPSWLFIQGACFFWIKSCGAQQAFLVVLPTIGEQQP